MAEEGTIRPQGDASKGGDGIDWAALHRRLETAHAALQRRLNPDTKEKQEILRERARLLAREKNSKLLPSQSQSEVVEFMLASEHYAIEIGYVREIQPLYDLTALPCTPPFVLGLANVRGQILSVIDIKKLFDLPEKGLTDLHKIICVRANQVDVGILADSILGVRWIGLNEIQSSLPTLTGMRAEYLKGVTKDSLVVLDVAKIMADQKLVVDQGRTKGR